MEPIRATARFGRIEPHHPDDTMERSPPHSRSAARAAGLAIAAAVAIASSACGRSPEKQATESVAAIRSWTATAKLAGESWLRDKAPSAYTRTTLESAETTLRQELGTLQQGPLPPSLRGDLGLLRAPAPHARAMADAVQRGDRGAVAAEVVALSSLDARLGALDERLQAAARKP